jgi:hypothetical protein
MEIKEVEALFWSGIRLQTARTPLRAWQRFSWRSMGLEAI